MTHKGFLKRTMAMVLAASMLFGEGNGLVLERLLGTVSVKADDLSSQKENEITSLDYFNAADAIMQKSAVGATSYGSLCRSLMERIPRICVCPMWKRIWNYR